MRFLPIPEPADPVIPVQDNSIHQDCAHLIVVLFVFLIASTLQLSSVSAKPDISTLVPENISVSADPIILNNSSPEQRKFGKLIWKGGVQLRSESPFFGGFSGLVIDPKGEKIVSISDSGIWLSGTISYTSGHPTGLENVRIGPLSNRKGKPFSKNRDRDAEAITLYRGNLDKGSALIAFERNTRIAQFPIRNQQIGTQKKLLRLNKSLRRLSTNNGIEALSYYSEGINRGKLIVFPERLLEPKEFLNGWLVDGKKQRRLRVRRLRGFDITDVAALPEGGALLLERRFRYSEGIKMRIRQLSANEINRDKRLDGQILFEADDSFNIDNMEGIAVHKSRNNETIVTLISDDNFNFFQRTLLMQFKLPANTR